MHVYAYLVWPQICYVLERDLDCRVFLTIAPKCWDYRYGPLMTDSLLKTVVSQTPLPPHFSHLSPSLHPELTGPRDIKIKQILFKMLFYSAEL